jgi:hypothetical protein
LDVHICTNECTYRVCTLIYVLHFASKCFYNNGSWSKVEKVPERKVADDGHGEDDVAASYQDRLRQRHLKPGTKVVATILGDFHSYIFSKKIANLLKTNVMITILCKRIGKFHGKQSCDHYFGYFHLFSAFLETRCNYPNFMPNNEIFLILLNDSTSELFSSIIDYNMYDVQYIRCTIYTMYNIYDVQDIYDVQYI